MTRLAELFKKHEWSWWAGRILLGLAVLLLVAFLLGTLNRSRLLARYPPIGEMVDVGGYRLHLYCMGIGEPTVIIESGMGGPGISWAHIQPEIAKTTRVCVYDRAGLGWSDPGPQPRTSEVITEELHALLVNAAVPGPYVLVGYSSGGLVTRLFAYHYPEEVTGMVLIDAAHGEQLERLQVNAWLLPVLPRLFGVLPLLARSGIPALAPELMPLPGKEQLPAEAYATYQALMAADPDFVTAVHDEFLAVAENLALARAVDSTESLGDIPLIVIANCQSDGMDSAGPSPAQQAYERIRHELQSELAALSTNGRLVIAYGSGHDIPFQRPDLVIEAIRDVVAVVQAQ
ncbi:MAG TPA: alpha/beta hydrolase [Anaerolineae bacterium]